MGQELANLDAFKGGPAQAFKQGPQESGALSDGIGSSYGVINYKGKNWSLRYRGEKKLFTRPDDGTPLSYIDVIVLRSADIKSKSYFKKYDPAGSSEGERPLCSSLDGVTPDRDVIAKQAEACAICPRNQWKLNEEGRKGRECQDYKRLAVMILPNLTKPLFGSALMEPVFLRVPPASLNNLGMMGDLMDAQGYNYWTYITRITFDPAKSHPEMLFRALQPLDDKAANIVLPMRQDPLCLRITGQDEQRLAITQAPAPAVTQVQALPTPATPPPATEAIPMDTGFGDETYTVPVTPVQPVQPAQVTAADTGAPASADSALDARIAKLMPAVSA